MEEVVYRTKGVCSTEIRLQMEGNIIKQAVFTNGCNGNLQGIAKLIEGMEAEEVIKRLEGVTCGRRMTSCPDQLATALKTALAGQK